jgi:cytochrome c peroxidase
MKGAAVLLLLAAGAAPIQSQYDTREILHLPKGFPLPRIPLTNPLTREKVLLGRYLFYDKRMSVTGTYSCGACHKQGLAFTDGMDHAVGATGQRHPRSAMSLVNVAWNEAFNWGDKTVHSLEEQALKPMMGTDPVELGFNSVQKSFLQLVESDIFYHRLFASAFPRQVRPWTVGNVTMAIASFERTIVSGRSPWDRFHFDGDENAIPESAKRGEQLFFLPEIVECFRCHAGFNFSDSSGRALSGAFHNTGLYNLAGIFSYPPGGRGVFESSRDSNDVGKFRTPTLRNIAVTAPYMHDGSAASLADVIDHYAAGGRTIADGENAGRGSDNLLKDRLVHGFAPTKQNKTDLIAFLESLTDDELLSRDDLSDPWIREPFQKLPGAPADVIRVLK